MQRTMMLVLTVMLQALPSASTQAQEISAESLRSFFSASGAVSACIISKGQNRPLRNVLVWPQGGHLSALIYRTDLAQTVPSAVPCWSGNGACVLFEGPLAGAADLCESSDGMVATGNANLVQRNLQSNLAPDLEAIAAALMPMAADLTGAETWAARLEGHAVFMSEGERGTRRTRIDGLGGPFTISRLRPSWDALDLLALEAAMAALGTRELALVGPEGVLSADGRVYFRGSCFGVASATEVRTRLVTANLIVELEIPPDTGSENAVFDDVVQGLLGGTPIYGAPVIFAPEQDPLTLLFLQAQMDLCP